MSQFTSGKKVNQLTELLYEGQPVFLNGTKEQVFYYDEEIGTLTSRLIHPLSSIMYTSKRYIQPNQLFTVHIVKKVTSRM